MNGDLSRTTFDPSKSYSSVRAQQGRATLDADLNEQVDIQLHDQRKGQRALIGPSGGHVGEAGFDITVNNPNPGNALTIQPGRYWVDGVEVALGGPAINYTNQPSLPGAALPTTAGRYLAYLDVWERPISAIQDPSLREVALGGPDTSTRTQVVWQVRLLKVTTNDPQPDCMTPFNEWSQLIGGPQGTLEVRVANPGPVNDPCLIPASAGYRGLENQLYRIQIHAGNFVGTALNVVDGAINPTFKWSRDNGSVVAAWRGHPAPLDLIVDRLGPGGAAGFRPDDWVELSNDQDDLLGQGGVVGRIVGVDADKLALDPLQAGLEASLSPVSKANAMLHSQVRRWDSAGVRATAAQIGQSDVTADGWIRVEDGIEVRFSGGPFRPGSFWTIPARTATLPGTLEKQIDWPTAPNHLPMALTARGPVHHYTRLGLFDLNGTTWTRITDCRQLFPNLTELVQIQTLGGDGQHGRAKHWLPAPISVSVVRGGFPVAGARVKLAIVPSSTAVKRGYLSATMPGPNGQLGALDTVIVTTDANGQASGWWELGNGQPVDGPGDNFQRDDAQEVTATLMAPDDSLTPQVARFTASVLDNYQLVAVGGDGQLGWPGDVLTIAPRVRVTDGGRPVVGATVEFAVLNVAFQGAPLDQFAGGSVFSNQPVSTVLWPNGNLAQIVRVWTNAWGVAQVQWKTGNHPSLPVQKLDARLIDESGQVSTAQTTMFTAHHSVAREISCAVPSTLQALTPPGSHLQVALEGVAAAFAKLGLPQWAIQARVVDAANNRLAIQPSLSVARAQFISIDLQAIFPVGFTPPQVGIDNALAIWLEVPFNAGMGHTRVRLTGTSTQQGTTLNWLMPPQTTNWLLGNPILAQPARVTVELMPSALGMLGNPQQWMFNLTA